MSYQSRQSKRAKRRNQKKNTGRRRPLAVSRAGYYSTKRHRIEILELRRQQQSE